MFHEKQIFHLSTRRWRLKCALFYIFRLKSYKTVYKLIDVFLFFCFYHWLRQTIRCINRLILLLVIGLCLLSFCCAKRLIVAIDNLIALTYPFCCAKRRYLLSKSVSCSFIVNWLVSLLFNWESTSFRFYLNESWFSLFLTLIENRLAFCYALIENRFAPALTLIAYMLLWGRASDLWARRRGIRNERSVYARRRVARL